MRIIKLAFVGCILMVGQLMVAQTSFRGRIVDEETKTPIKGAKISISNQGIGALSNDKGYFAYSKYHQILDKYSELTITAPGYKNVIKSGAEIRQLLGTVSTVYLEKGGKQKKKKQSLDKVHIYWDISAATVPYDSDKVWDKLTAFMTESKVKTVYFTSFSSTVMETEKIEISEESLTALREKISNQDVYGFSDYSIVKDQHVDAIILISNGDPFYSEAQLQGRVPTYVYPIGEQQNGSYLNSIVQFTDGGFLETPKGLRNDGTTAIGRQIKGTVSSVSGPVQGAGVIRKGSLQEYFSKASGSFEIPADEGDILTFSYLGMRSKTVLVEDSSTPLHIQLEPLAEVLDEVTLEGKAKEKEEKVLTGYGEESRDKLGYSANYITSENIKPSAQYVSDILRGQFAGVRILGFGPNASIQIRSGSATLGGTGSGGPLFVIDNNILAGTSLSEINGFVDPQNIESISILKSASATVRYGTLGIDGVVIIRTKTGTKAETDENGVPVSLLVTGNEYEGEDLLTPDYRDVKEAYITQLDQLPNTEAKYQRYMKMEAVRDPSLAFYIDMAQYFRRLDTGKAEEILNKLMVLGGENAKVLRIVAYLYEEAGDVQKARRMYERIVKLAPGKAQSYRDLAMIYQETDEYNKALELYINMLSGRIVGINFEGMESYLVSELNHLIAKYKDKIEYERLPNEWLQAGYNVDLRMVVEWSDHSTPFEFQFVNPDRKYFKWAHTLDQNKERMFLEQEQGFQMEEFIVDDAPSGNWIVNIQYLGEASNSALPPYIKYTLYRNFGTSREQKEVKVIKLYLQDDKVTLSRIKI